ncbi:MAG: universal stress protein, partial [Chloroflexi bacterium]|nr:universal stress protein [Chloroflexota bacterium]
MTDDYKRPDPDALLALIKAQEAPQRGQLRIYLGAAPGVGKTYAMLQEARRRKSRGTDVVAGFVETHGRPEIEEQLAGLEVVPPREVLYRGTVFREMNTDAVIARHPKVALVDELAHTNVPGSKHEKRYQDVQDLLDAGITVISTLNIQHLESLSDYVRQTTGVEVRETISDSVVDGADQVELIDLTPEALIERMKEGDIYPPEQARQALGNFFTVDNLTTLRDLALRATAREVEEKLDAHLRTLKVDGSAAVGERIMVAVDHRTVGKTLIRRARRMAAALKGELIVVHVEPTEGRRQPQSLEEERQLRANLELADELGAKVVRLRGKVADELITYARANHISQLFIGHPSHGRWQELLRGSVTADILRKMPGLNVHVMADRSGAGRDR